MSWRPAAPAELRQRALAQALAIAEALRGDDFIGLEAALGGGTPGLALFFAYLAELVPNRGYDEVRDRFVDAMIDGVARNSDDPSLYGGYSGAAWVIEHIQGDANDEQDANEEVDQGLLALFGPETWTGQFDLISGLAGYGVYALERRNRSSAAELRRRIVDQLERLAERNGGTATWHTPHRLLPPNQQAQFPDGYYNLGLAHGVPGVIAFLAGACAFEDTAGRAAALLEGAVSWLLANGCADGQGFGYYLIPGGPKSGARTAWCYGDPGVAANLLLAARALDRADWHEQALAAARRAAARSYEDSGVVDASLCHGAAGLAQAFARLHQAWDDPALGQAAERWLGETLKMAQPGEGIAGYRYWFLDGWRNDPGFLEGAAGIGLTLLAAATDYEPGWDRVLQLSLR
jgi:lantibiotic modifying enzyme